MPKLILILNPTAGNGRGEKNREKLLGILGNAGWTVDLFQTRAAGHAEEFVADLVSKGNSNMPERIVCAGGDGTINEVANGLAGGGLRHEVSLGIVPIGTANVVAKTFNIPNSIPKSAEIAAGGQVRTIDLGVSGGRLFVMSSGIGFDAAVTKKIKELRTGAKSTLKGLREYVGPSLDVLKNFNFPELAVSIDGEDLGIATSLIIGNLREYGGPMVFTPDAVPDDGKLDLCVFRGQARSSLVKYFLGGITRIVSGFGDVDCRQGEKITIKSREHVPVQLDGDYFDDVAPDKKWEISIMPGALNLVVPSVSKGK